MAPGRLVTEIAGGGSVGAEAANLILCCLFLTWRIPLAARRLTTPAHDRRLQVHRTRRSRKRRGLLEREGAAAGQ